MKHPACNKTVCIRVFKDVSPLIDRYSHSLKKPLLCMCFLFSIIRVSAQEPWQHDFEQMFAYVEDTDENTLTLLFDELCDRYINPLNINTATREEWEKLSFLSEKQIEELQAYVYTHGPMKTLGELLLIKGLDLYTRNLLRHFVYIGDVNESKRSFSWKDMVRYGRHEAVARLDIPLYEKAGYKSYSDSILARYPNRCYLGDPFHHTLRYNFSYKDKVNMGFVADKDAGEPFFDNGNESGFDYYSYYLFLSNIGAIKTLALGNYRLRFGMGLVMNTDLSLGKLNTLSSMGWGGRGIKKHSSSSEYNAFRGLAATFRLWKRTELSAFYSYHKQDANLDKDLLITSWKTDGLHRTLLEYSKKGNVTNSLIGSNITSHFGPLHIGLTAVYNRFNRALKSSDKLYKKYDPRGKEFLTIGVDYQYYSPLFRISGETAMSRRGGWATLNRFQFTLWDDWNVTLLQRYYARNYHSLYGNSFSENSELRNESGVYLAVDVAPFSCWKFDGYIDFCYFPWFKYQVSSSSYSGEGMLRAVFTPHDEWNFTLRYRLKMAERDFTDVDKHRFLLFRYHHRFRYQQDYSPNRLITLSTIIDYNCLHHAELFEQGSMLTQRFSWTPHKLPISLYSSFSYFNTDSYSTRTSVYERGLIYSFSFPSYYSHGYHLGVVCQYAINKQLSTAVRFSHTHYFDRPTIGSGTELIDASHRQDISIQLRWRR